jgi:hypothetical protein
MYLIQSIRSVANVFAILVLMLCISAAAHAADKQSSDKKLIHYGWDTMNEQQLEQAVGKLQHLPFDGLSIRNRTYINTFYNRGGLDDASIEAAVAATSRIKWGKFTDNFVNMFAGAHSQWFNDAAWAEDGHIIRNVRTLARMAKAGKCRGIIFDPEFITHEQERKAGPWNYEHQELHTRKSFDEYRAMVRRRAVQIIDTIEAELPNPTFLSLFWGQYGFRDLAMDTDPKLIKEVLGGEEYGLLHDFFLGLLEGADPGTKIVDGNEPSYYANSAERFQEQNAFVHETMLNLVPAELHDKYRAQVSIGHAIYVDVHSNTRESHYISTYLTRPERALGMERIVYLALKHSDRYVWFYAQKPCYLLGNLVDPLMIPAIEQARHKVATGAPLGIDWDPIERRAGKAYNRAKNVDLVPLTAKVARTTSAPRLDGKLAEPFWESATRLGPFTKFMTGPHPLTAAAKAWMAYDDTNLYLAFHTDIHDKRTKLEGPELGRDNEQRGNGDYLEVGIAADEAAAAYYHIRLNCHNNHRWDSLTPASVWPNEISGKDDSWTGDYRTATYEDPGVKFWTAELVIPWTAIGRSAPQSGDEIKGNLVVRTDRPVDHGSYQLMSWSPMRRARLIEARTLGTWKFE